MTPEPEKCAGFSWNVNYFTGKLTGGTLLTFRFAKENISLHLLFIR